MVSYIFVAHPDDAVLGCGGTIARYVKLRKNIKLVALTYGEFNAFSDPKLHTKQKLAEFEKAAEALGLKKALCLGLEDFKIEDELKREDVRKQIADMFLAEKPHAVYTHCIDDTNKSHRRVALLIKNILHELKIKCEIYTFSYGLRFLHREKPKLNIDISNFYLQKRKAVQAFATQKPWIDITYSIVWFKDKLAGLKLGYRFSEQFRSW